MQSDLSFFSQQVLILKGEVENRTRGILIIYPVPKASDKGLLFVRGKEKSRNSHNAYHIERQISLLSLIARITMECRNNYPE